MMTNRMTRLQASDRYDTKLNGGCTTRSFVYELGKEIELAPFNGIWGRDLDIFLQNKGEVVGLTNDISIRIHFGFLPAESNAKPGL